MPSRNLWKRNSERIKFRGLGVSPGVAIGHVRLFHVSTLDVGESVVIPQNVQSEVQRFQDAVAQTRIKLMELGKRVGQRGEDKALTEVLTMHLMLLEDKMIYDRAIQLIREERYGAEYALASVVREARKRYAGLPDLFRERISDVEDICRRIMDMLRGVHTQTLEDLDEEAVIVARDLSPSDTASMHREMVLGFVTEAGGKTSHTAILARALEIPAVIGVPGISRFAQDNDPIIIDGDTGYVILNPPPEDIKEYRDRQNQYQLRQSRLIQLAELEPITLDGYRIDLAANIEFATEVESIVKYRANGVGLYRTEYLFLNTYSVPTEEEQYRHYSEVAAKLAPKPVVIRTLDIGGDKFAHSLDTPHEMNPFLGCRAIRFSLANQPIFRTQLQAILRASVWKNLMIMYPLISSRSELVQAGQLLDSIKADFRRQGIPFDENIRVGAMIEVPSAVIIARDLAPLVDFFSIGTNDLIQYTLAVDRGNENIAYLYQPLHPAVLRMIVSIVNTGREFGLPVDVCGEMASDPVCALVLLALGIESLSMAPHAIPLIKQVVRSVVMVQLREFGAELLDLSSVADIRKRVQQALPKLVHDKDGLVANLYESNILADT
ncbi:MAG TPA: phosphoenolpyruvate--protein phosphotransferase [bacterium]|nr:phosphoenolpyruvate--protein phosphotransferase [Candidatus Omnitrophota bacterium]HOL93036.1 phosphoenolpyruvate--protein phosphotransferase [bacterium]HPO99463.1 phosphoenolpyruvate--protein phosphotransferase [bacterium]